MLGVKRGEVYLAPHDAGWAALFEEAQREMSRIHGANALDIQHVGSTAIRGIAAKPILDIAVAVRDMDALNIEGMQDAGYVFSGEAGVAGRAFFAKYRDGDISTHHIHCYLPDNQNLLDNIAFRDYLNAHPEYVAQYHALKQALAAKYPGDRARYTREKTDFIQMILARTSQARR